MAQLIETLQPPQQHAPDWPAAAVAGLAAGAILMVLDLFWSTAVMGTGPWITSRRIAAIFLGADTVKSADFSVGVVALALVVHYSLGVFSGLVLAWIFSRLRYGATVSMDLLVGAVFGLVIYIVNFYVLTRVFPWFVESRGAATLLAHLVFGMAAAFLYWRLERRQLAAGATA